MTVKLTSKQYNDQTGQNQDDKLVDHSAYQSLVGKLLYLNCNTPEILEVKQVLRLVSTRGVTSHGLKYGPWIRSQEVFQS